MVYQEWLRVDSDMKRQADASHRGNREGTGGDTFHEGYSLNLN